MEIPVQTNINVAHNLPDLIYININIHTIVKFMTGITMPLDYHIDPNEIGKLGEY